MKETRKVNNDILPLESRMTHAGIKEKNWLYNDVFVFYEVLFQQLQSSVFIFLTLLLCNLEKVDDVLLIQNKILWTIA